MSDVKTRWKALEQWGAQVSLVQPLSGGVANEVWSVRYKGVLTVARLGNRDDADLQWETELLQYLNSKGLSVPEPIPTTDGQLFANGIVLMSYVEGNSPESENDWHRVADTLRKLHALTENWPQRPGWRSSVDFLSYETGTKVDLTAMPAEAVARCRAAWQRLKDLPTCVIHGDSNNYGNVRVTRDRVTLIDWDESHVDVPILDLVLPHNAGKLDPDSGEFDIGEQASAAWEAVVCWDDDYARKRLAEVREI